MAQARWATADVLDDGLDAMDAAVDVMIVCSGASPPADYAAAAAAALATKTSPTLTVAASGTDRKCTISEALGLTIDAGGDATHIALAKSTATTKLWFVTTCTQQTLVLGGTVDVPEWVITVKQPTAPA